uniref:Lipase domain-containing protein n=1 Tax=Dendroctonus ponderosae TaxID=77166 RepID=A0AAR5P4G5_DENPD
MHVNSYFIESLVLCFSCGGDNGNFGNGDLGSDGTLCSMDTPSRMVIAKQVHWSDQIGDQCDSGGPIQYDLPAIQQIIRLQLQTPPPSCDAPPTKPDPSSVHLKQLSMFPDGSPQFPPPLEPPNSNWTPINPQEGPLPDGTTRPVDAPQQSSDPQRAVPQYWNPYPATAPSWRPPLAWPLAGPQPGHPNGQAMWPVISAPQAPPGQPPYPQNIVPRPAPYWIPLQSRPAFDWYPLGPSTVPSGPPSFPAESTDDASENDRPWGPEPQWIPNQANRPTDDLIPLPGLDPFAPDQGSEAPLEPMVDPPIDYNRVTIKEASEPAQTDVTETEIIQPESPQDAVAPNPDPEPQSVDLVTITLDQSEGLISRSIAQSAEIGVEVDAWLQEHPDGQIVIVITAEETSKPTWPQEVKEIFSSHDPESPTLVLVVDWSKYVFSDYTVTVEYSFEVARQLNAMILQLQVPLERLTILAFGTSAHIAGYIGKLTESMQGATVYRIIALNPTGLLYTDVVDVEHRLSRSDASTVLVIHTETVQIGYGQPIGTIDVYVNQPENGQIWCGGDAQCSHEAAIEIFIRAYRLRPVLVTNDLTNELLWGFPLDVPSGVAGVFHLLTDEQGVPQSLPPESWPMETVENYPSVDKSQFPGRNVANMMLMGQRTDGSEITLAVDQPDPNLGEFLLANPLGEVFVILTEQPRGQWAEPMKQALLGAPGPKYVLIVDWSPHVYPSYVFTVNAFSHLVAETVYGFLKINNVPLGLTEMIGFSTSAHVAGMVGALAAADGQELSRITGLDPEARMWENSPQAQLSQLQATIVQVIHTNTRSLGILQPLGHYDIYMFGGAEQPDCIQTDNVDSCSHLKAVEYYLASISSQVLAYEGELQGPQAVRTGDSNVVVGFNLLPSSTQSSRVYVVDQLLPINQAPLEIADLPMVANNWPPVQLVEAISGIVLHIQQVQGAAAQVTTIYFSRRHPQLVGLLRKLLNLSAPTPTYLIVDGEYLNDDDWSLALADKILKTTEDQAVLMRLDWSMYKAQTYAASASYSRAIGSFAAQFLLEVGLLPSNLHIIGFSIGAHIAGFIGKQLQSENGGNQVARISALDPARPMFEHPEVAEQSRLAALDAQHVDVYHSNILVHGFTAPIGSIDYYINGGLVQPGCSGGDHLCAHYRAVQLFILSLDIRDMAIGVRYEEVGKLVFVADATFADFGFFFENGQPGVYYLKTELTEPYLKPAERIAAQTANEIVAPEAGGVDLQADTGDRAPAGYIDVYQINVPTAVETFTEIIQIQGEPQQTVNTYTLRSNFNSSRSA